MTYECVKEGTTGEKVDIETFVITECNRKQRIRLYECGVHFDYGLFMNSYRLIKYDCTKDSAVCKRQILRHF